MTFTYEKTTWLSVSRLSSKLKEQYSGQKRKISLQGQTGETLTIGQLSVHIGDTIIEVDTLPLTVVLIEFWQLRCEVVAVFQFDFPGTTREVLAIPDEPTCRFNSQCSYCWKLQERRVKDCSMTDGKAMSSRPLAFSGALVCMG